MKVLKFLSVLLLALSFVQCGGGGGGGSSVTLPKNSLKGTYTLKAFMVQYSTGYTFNQTDFPHWKGTMKISPNVITTEYDLDGDESGWTEIYTVQYDDQNHDSGLLFLANGDSADFGVIASSPYDIEIAFNGFSAERGNYYEVDTWHKIGDGF